MPADPSHLGWHSRGYLPHLDAPGEIQAITFRLGDAVPTKVIERWKQELPRSDENSSKVLRQKIARYEDAGHGSCLLKEPAIADIVQDVLLHFDSIRYRLIEWVVMPNHIHVLIRCIDGFPIPDIIRSWKTFSARAINALLGTTGPLWARDYHDRYVRDADHLTNVRAYIRNNPVKAGLCTSTADWKWSSAFHHQ